MATAPPLEDRDRFIDLLRVACIVAVVLGHWATTTVVWEPDRVLSVNALSVVPWTRAATWLIQVMPLVFFAGGFANSVSRRRTGSYLTYLDGRLGRLLVPTGAFLGVWLALGLATEALDPGSPGKARLKFTLSRGDTRALASAAGRLIPGTTITRPRISFGSRVRISLQRPTCPSNSSP